MYNIEKNCFEIFVQLRPQRDHFTQALRQTTALLREHSGVEAGLAGLCPGRTSLNLTLGVAVPAPLDDQARVAADAATAFVSALFSQMEDYLPLYVGEPTPAEVEEAQKFQRMLSQAQFSMPVEADERIPTR